MRAVGVRCDDLKEHDLATYDDEGESHSTSANGQGKPQGEQDDISGVKEELEQGIEQVRSTDGAFLAQLRSGAVMACRNVSAVGVPRCAK